MHVLMLIWHCRFSSTRSIVRLFIRIPHLNFKKNKIKRKKKPKSCKSLKCKKNPETNLNLLGEKFQIWQKIKSQQLEDKKTGQSKQRCLHSTTHQMKTKQKIRKVVLRRSNLAYAWIVSKMSLPSNFNFSWNVERQRRFSPQWVPAQRTEDPKSKQKCRWSSEETRIQHKPTKNF